MAPRLSGQTSIFGVVVFVSKSPLGIERQKKLEQFAILTRKPRSHARILIYRTTGLLATFGKLINRTYSCTSEEQKNICQGLLGHYGVHGYQDVRQ